MNYNALTTNHDTTDGISFTTASVSPTSNRLILIAIGARSDDGANPETPTVTGNGITYTLITSRQPTGTANRMLFLFRGLSASPTSGAITINFGTGNTMRSCVWSVNEFYNVVTTGTNGADAIVQSNTNAADTTSLTVTLSAFAKATNGTYGCFLGADGLLTMAIESSNGYTQLANQQDTESNTLLAEFKDGTDTSVSETQTASGVSGIAVELNAFIATALGNKIYADGII